MFNDWYHSLLFRIQNEVTSGRNHGEFGGRNDLEGFNGVLNADKIVISDNDEKVGGCSRYAVSGLRTFCGGPNVAP
jgi:hypothetical protein